MTSNANGATQQVSYMGTNGTGNGPIAVHRIALLETLVGELAPGIIRFSSKLNSIQTAATSEEVSSSTMILSLNDGTIIKAKGMKRLQQTPKLLQKDVIENLAKDFPPSFLEVVQHADLATLTWALLMFRYPWDLIFGHMCKGNIIVAGDAMHPMTLELGQGGCSALEDATILGELNP